MNKSVKKSFYKAAVEYLNGSFIEHWYSTIDGSKFFTVKFPSGVALDYKRLCNARKAALSVC